MIVVSDLEGTLTTGATWGGFGRFLQHHGRALSYNLFLLSRLPGVPLARAHIINKRAYQVKWITDQMRLFKGATLEEAIHMGEWVVEHEMWPQRRADALAELEQHRRAGARVIIVSGTYQPIADAFAQRIGAEAIGTPLAYQNGSLTGRLATPIITLDLKVERIRALVGPDVAIDVAYGDTAADLPMLEMAANPVAVYPDEKLRAIAAGRGWRILESG